MTDRDEKKLSGGISRRSVMRTAGAVGLSTAMFGGALAARPRRAYAAFDPKKYAGTEINFMTVGGEGDERALAELTPQFEAETGMKVKITSPALGPLIEKTLQNLKAERSAYEIISFLGFLTTQQVGNGYYLQLNEFKDNPDETPPDWDFDDFIPNAVKNVGYYDLKNKIRGKGPDLYAIPGTHSGSVIYFYRKDLFEKVGLKPAKTWDEFKAAAQKLNKDGVAGCSFIGANDASLALVDWYTRFITIGGKMMSGDPKTKDFMPHIDSKESIEALQMLIDCLPYAPKNVTQYGFAENVDGFSTGKIAQMIFWSTIAGPVFNKDKSIVADKTGTGPVPAGPGQKARAIQGGWGLAIPKNVDPAKKMAAWRALTWWSNKHVNHYLIDKYQIDANRISAFTDPTSLKNFPYLKDDMDAIADADTIPTSNIDECFQINDILNVEFNKALIGGQDAKTACANAQTQVIALLKKAGHLT